MSTVIMLFILPLGILLFYWDKKNYRFFLKPRCLSVDLSSTEPLAEC